MPELLLPLAVAVLAVGLAYLIWRQVRLQRTAAAYLEARALLSQTQRSSSEDARLDRARARARSLGPEMDPGVPAVERLKMIRPDYRWITQNIRGDEDVDSLNDFADVFLALINQNPRGINSRMFGDAILQFTRLTYMRERDRLKATGLEGGAASDLGKAQAEAVARHFLAEAAHSDGTWTPIAPTKLSPD